MEKKTEQLPVPGVNKQFTQEELKAENERIVKEKLKIIGEINKINYPLSVSVFTHGKPWTIRNISFWKAMQKRDEDVLEFMQTYLTEEK